MNKEEYIQTLERYLVGKIDPDELRDTITYYQDYFAMETQKGKTESEVITILGEPRYLAKSIISAKGGAQTEETVSEVEDTDGYQKIKEPFIFRLLQFFMKLPTWAISLLVLCVVLLVLSLAITVLHFLLPILIPVIIILCVIRFLRNR